MEVFSYFDQFEDIEIDFNSYLLNKSNSNYTYSFSNKQPSKATIKNIFTHYEIVSKFKSNIDLIYNYVISETDTPEKISFDQYGKIDYWWIVLLFNNIKNPWTDWPLSQDHLTKLVEILYTGEGKYSKETYYQFMFEKNESKRSIILPKGYVINDIIWAFKEQING